ncbi:hypothetical protein J2Z21_003666 [Streptomyces griseochromogenes]|uniref:Tetratricopeptide repeat protein n=1 Tax=Streptomyces griseochromogenes TaxID=68214 RepID=A0A1B1AP39_9ACTN|nr:tetratricopeptide repeat protein [Streptomyces griseochromogenes]ANP48339.1 hypothetical protein AVL59_01005 [Streptomyces griseochromogenes]MBP2050716.1 hypothetical protein [Streptomyces griseochromogenes]
MYGLFHPQTLAALAHLARELAADGRHDEAAERWQHLLDRYRGTTGPGHPGTMSALAELAQALETAGRHAEALECLQQLLVAYKGHAGSAPPGAPDALPRLWRTASRALFEADHDDDTRQYLRQLAARYRIDPGPGEPDADQDSFAADPEVHRLLQAMTAHLAARRGVDAYGAARLLVEELTARNTDLFSDAVRKPETPCAGFDQWAEAPSGDDLPVSDAAVHEHSLDDLFAAHAARVAGILDDASDELEECGPGAPGHLGACDLDESKRLAEEAREAVNSDLIALFLRLGPPPEAIGRDHYEPVNSGGGGTQE